MVPPEFVDWLRSRVGEWADEYNLTDRQAFQAWALAFAHELDDDTAREQSETLTQGDAGVDGWDYDSPGGIFHLTQCKYPDDASTVAGVDDLQDLLRGLALLGSPADIADGPHREGLLEVATRYKSAVEDDSAAVVLDFFVAGGISGPARTELAIAAEQAGATAEFYDLERLYQLYESREIIDDLSGTSVDFPLAGVDQHYPLDDVEVTGIQSALVATVDGRRLGIAIADHVPRVFHRNVRYHLGNKNAVNKSIEATLRDAEDRRAFWLYNNGITLVCDSFEVIEDGEQTIVRASNPQIVNGAQTASALEQLRGLYADGEVAVQARFVSVDNTEAGKQALRRISEYTNSQSAVRAADLRGNDPRHVTLQQRFRLLESPVFYERRRGEWEALTAAAKAPFNTRRVRKDDIGQRWRAFAGEPALAVADKESMYTDPEVAASSFDPDRHPDLYLLAHDLFGIASSLLNKSAVADLNAVKGGLTDDQIDGLRRAKNVWAAHATALIGDILVERYGTEGQLEPENARSIRARLAEDDSAFRKFLLSRALQATRRWMTGAGGAVGVKAALQHEGSLQLLRDELADVLVDSDLDEALPDLDSADET